MILNEEYYQKLWEKFEPVETLNVFDDNTSCLTTKLILDHYRKGQSIHVNFQDSKQTLFEVGRQLFIEFANDIYFNHYDLPTLKVGDKLRDKRKYKDGKKHDYIIKRINNGSFSIEHTKNKAQLNITYDSLVKKFIPIEKGSRQLQGYTKYFSDLNGGIKLDFTPTNFEMKSVFIAKKLLWDSLNEISKIPSTYYPNPREEHEVTEMKSIPALSNSIIYFTPKYEVCYRNILSKGEKIKTIIVFDTEGDKIPQILQDKVRFGFNLIILSNSYSPLKNEAVPCWNWFKEEIEIVEAL